MAVPISQFVQVHRVDVAARWYAKVRELLPGGEELTSVQTMDSMGIFLDEMIKSLRGGARATAGGNDVAREHGRQRYGLGTGLAQLVREYGLCCESMIEIADEQGETLSSESQLALTRFLFVATSEAVDEYMQRETGRRRQSAVDHRALVADELTGPLSVVKLSLDAFGGQLSVDVAAGLNQGLDRASELLRPAANAGAVARTRAPALETLNLRDLVAEAMERTAALAVQRGVRLESQIDPGLTLATERPLLLSALTDLITNAARCTKLGSTVTTRARLAEGRLVLEVQDQCGGLDSQRIAVVFAAFRGMDSESHASRSDVGLALTVEAVEALRGSLNVANDVGVGCRFVVDLPLHATKVA